MKRARAGSGERRRREDEMITNNKHNDSYSQHHDHHECGGSAGGAGSAVDQGSRGSGLTGSAGTEGSVGTVGSAGSIGSARVDGFAGVTDAAHAATAADAAGTRSTQAPIVGAERLAGFVRTQTATATPQRIVESLTTLVSTEVLVAGTRLPTVRALASTLHVSPATVSAAYHMLARSGVVHSRGRAGTFVLPQALSEVNIPPASAATTTSGAGGRQSYASMSATGAGAVFEPSRTVQIHGTRGVTDSSGTHAERNADTWGFGRTQGLTGSAVAHAPVIDLSRGTPDNTLLPTIRPYLARLGNRRAFVNSYTGPTILPMLEEELRGDWPYDPQAMTMVSGAGDGLALAIAAFVRHGDVVVVESPTYPFILDVLRERGAIAVGVPVDAEGMDSHRLLDVLERFGPTPGPTREQGRRISMIIIQPRAQNPTGISYTPERLSAISRVLRIWEQEVVGRDIPLIVEDDSSGMVADVFAVSLGSLLPDRVIHIRSFSKSHGPDLRLAALSGPREAVDAIVERRRLGAGWVSRFLQELLCEMLADRQAYTTIAGARHTYALRRKTMAALLERFGMRTVEGSGFNMWLPVRDPVAARRILAQEHIRVAEGGRFLPEFRVSAGDDGLRSQERVLGGDNWQDDIVLNDSVLDRAATGGAVGATGLAVRSGASPDDARGDDGGQGAGHTATIDQSGMMGVAAAAGMGGSSHATPAGIGGSVPLTDAGIAQGNAMRVTISQPEAISEHVAQCLVHAATA